MVTRSDLPAYNEYGLLWLAVIALAIDDACMRVEVIPDEGTKGLAYTENQWTRRRADLWLHSRERGVGSLEWVCTVLNLSAEAIRNEYKRRLQTGPDGSRDWRDEDGVGLLEQEDGEASDAGRPSTDTTRD